MKKVVITGISGQDGSYLANFLLKKNYKVIGLTRSINKSFNGLEFLGIKNEIELIESSLNTYKFWKKLIEDYQIDEIYNLSSLSSVGQSFNDVQESLDSNFNYFNDLLNIIFNINPNVKIFQASSSEMFGNCEEINISEKSKMNPVSPYGLSKLLSHKLAKYHRTFNDRFISTGILFNHESCLRSDKFVFKKIINYLVKKKLGEVNSKLRLGNISVVRDWGYAPYYVEAMWLINNHFQADEFVICSSMPTSLENIIDIGFKLIGLNHKDNIIIDKKFYRPAEIKKNSGDNSKAKKLLDWEYKFSHEELVSKLFEDELNFHQWKKENYV
jgi:GDPmannose 4,6-dehydratase